MVPEEASGTRVIHNQVRRAAGGSVHFLNVTGASPRRCLCAPGRRLACKASVRPYAVTESTETQAALDR
jgi:hypothetical protein